MEILPNLSSIITFNSSHHIYLSYTVHAVGGTSTIDAGPCYAFPSFPNFGLNSAPYVDIPQVNVISQGASGNTGDTNFAPPQWPEGSGGQITYWATFSTSAKAPEVAWMSFSAVLLAAP
jgi:hypothetical protein